MPMAMIRWICARLKADGGHPFEQLHMTGGEPTILDSFQEITARLAETGLPLSITTSGWRHGQDSWKELLAEAPFKQVYLSIDHPNREANDAVRGAGSWDLAMRTLRDSIQMRDMHGYPEITVISVVHRHNIRSLQRMWAFLQELGVDRWMPAHLEATANYADLAPTPEDLEWLDAARTRDPQFGASMGEAFHPESVPRSLIVHGLWPKDQEPHGCTTLGRLLVVHPNGGIYGCYGSEHRESTLLGQITGPDFPPFMQLLATAAHSVPDFCATCPEPVQHSNPLRRPHD